jgi:hypothetical protein
MVYSLSNINFDNGRIEIGPNKYVYDIQNLKDQPNKIKILKNARQHYNNEMIYYMKRQLNKGKNGIYLASTVIAYDNFSENYTALKSYRLCELCYAPYKNWNGDCVCENCNTIELIDKTRLESKTESETDSDQPKKKVAKKPKRVSKKVVAKQLEKKPDDPNVKDLTEVINGINKAIVSNKPAGKTAKKVATKKAPAKKSEQVDSNESSDDSESESDSDSETDYSEAEQKE